MRKKTKTAARAYGAHAKSKTKSASSSIRKALKAKGEKLPHGYQVAKRKRK